MVAVYHCPAFAGGFGVRAHDDREELAVAAGAPDDFLRAHLCFPIPFFFLLLLRL
jgi:hypothetical protein